MILGIGTDIISITRLNNALERIAERVFTPSEILSAGDTVHRNERLAGRWAAKEALAKALGCGIGEKCSWQDVEVSNTPNGCPEMILSGRALQTFMAMGGNKIHLSISHEKEYASAFVIIEGEK